MAWSCRSLLYVLVTCAQLVQRELAHTVLVLLQQLLVASKDPFIDDEDTSAYLYNVSHMQRLGRKIISEAQLRHPNCYRTICTWKNYTANDQFAGSPSPFDIDEDYKFTLRENEWPLYCRPDTFGYDSEEAEEVFPLKGYPKCSTKFPKYVPSMRIDPDTNTLIMNCSGTFKGRYVLGDSSVNSTIMLPPSFTTLPVDYAGPVQLDKEEWALGTCDPDNENLYEQVAIRIHKQEDVLHRAVSLAEVVREEASNMYGDSNSNPMIVMMLAIDSASRRHFYRKLPKTVQFLQSLNNESDFHVADFLIHNIIGDNSARNQIPVLTGKPRLVNRAIKELEGTPEALFHGDALEGQTLLSFLSELGFVTMLSFEFCHQYFATYMGDRPKADHLVANFWCGAKKYAGFNFEKSVLGQRCIGPQMSHQYMFEYINQFTEVYTGASQFIYTHVTTPHEATGTQIETLDEDLVAFLQQYLARVSASGYSVCIFLHGDHGMRYGEWYKNIKAFQEHRLPALFTIVSRPLLDQFDSSLDVLEHNRKRLVGKLDLHLTIKTLAITTYVKQIDRFNHLYQAWKKGGLRYSVSLFLEKIMNNRSCGDIYIPSFYCSCMKMEQIEESLFAPDRPSTNETSLEDLGRIINTVIELSLQELNAATYTSQLAGKGHVCQQLTIKSINSVFAQRISLRDEAFKVEFSVNEHPSARFETYTIVGVTEKLVGIKENQEGLVPTPTFFRSRKKRIRIMFVKRLDSYAGLCEEVAYARGINAALCVCDSVTSLRARQPLLLQELLSEVRITVGEEPGVQCDSVCESAGLKCDSQFFDVMTDEGLVLDAIKDLQLQTCVPSNFTALVKEQGEASCLVRLRELPQTCSALPPANFQLVCPCH